MSQFSDIATLLEIVESIGQPTEDNHDQRKQILQSIAEQIEENQQFQIEYGMEEVFTFIGATLSFNDSDLTVLEAALWALVRLCRQQILSKSTMREENCILVCANNGVIIEPFLKAFQLNYQSGTIAHIGFIFIMILASDSSERQQQLGSSDTPALLLQVLKAHPHNSNVVEFACRAIRNLCAFDDNGHKFIQEGIAEQLHFLLQESSFQHNTPQVIESIIFVIINLSYDLEIAKILGAMGCTLDLVETIPRMMVYGSVINRICWVLRNLTSTSNNISIVTNSFICDRLIEICNVYRPDTDTIQNAVWTISNIACSHENSTKLLHLQIMSLFQEIHHYGLENYHEDMLFGPIAEAIVFTIYNLASSADSSKSSLEAQQQEQQQHGDENNKMMHPFSPATSHISTNKEQSFLLQQTLGDQGACLLLDSYVERFYAREAMMEACARAIIKLTEDCSINKGKFAMLQTIRKLLKVQENNQEIVETIFLIWKALISLIDQCDENLLLFQNHSTEVIKFINSIMKNFIDIEEINVLGCQLLIYSGYYSKERMQQLIEEGFLDKYYKLNTSFQGGDSNTIGDYGQVLKDKLGITTESRYQADSKDDFDYTGGGEFSFNTNNNNGNGNKAPAAAKVSSEGGKSEGAAFADSSRPRRSSGSNADEIKDPDVIFDTGYEDGTFPNTNKTLIVDENPSIRLQTL